MKKTAFVFLLFYFSVLSSQTISTPLIYKIKEPVIKTEKPPVLILLHGYGSNEEDLFDLANALDGRLMTFSLRAPISLQNNGYCWFKLGEAPDGSLKYDYQEAKSSRKKVLDFIVQACRVYKLDSQSVYLLGFSQGAILSYDIALAEAGKTKGIMALSGRMLAQTKTLNTKWQLLAKCNFFIAHGNFDAVIPIKEGELAASFLKSKGMKEVTYQTYDMQHNINGKELNDIKSWLSKCLDRSAIEKKKTVTTPSKK